MDDYISIALLNDFIFCPYSIYLHNVYMEEDETLYKATPQIRGTIAHEGIDKKTGSTKKADIMSLPVYSESLRLKGKIDLYRKDKKQLIERKYQLKNIFRGQIYQLWAQYFCMVEMGFEVDYIGFYEISTNKNIKIELPSTLDRKELLNFIEKFRAYSPLEDNITVNTNKCQHCIYCNLCNKVIEDNVYT